MAGGDGSTIGALGVELLVADKQWSPALQRAASAIDALKAKVIATGTESAAAVRPLANALDQVTDAEKRALASVVAAAAAEKQRAAALGVSITQYRQVAAEQKRVAAEATRLAAAEKQATVATQQLGAATDKAAMSTRGMAAAGTNLRFQMFDVVQQLSAGQNPLMILNQQGFQVAQVFTQGGSALGVFRAALAPVIGMLGSLLATLWPVLLVVAALGAAYMVLNKQVEEAERVADGHAKAATRAQKALADGTPEADKARAAMEELTDATGGYAVALDRQVKAIEAEAAPRRKYLASQAAEAAAAYDDAIAHNGVTAAVRTRAETTARNLATFDAQVQSDKDAAAALAEYAQAQEDARVAAEKRAKAAAAAKAREAARKAGLAAVDELRAMRDAVSAETGVIEAALGDTEKVAATMRKALADADTARQEALDAAVKAYDEAMAQAAIASGDAGRQIADDARLAFRQAGIAAEDEYLARVKAAEVEAVNATRDAADKRIASARSSAVRRATDEEQYAAQVAVLTAEIAAVDATYADLSAEYRLAVEQALQGELDALRADYAQREAKRQAELAKQAAASWMSVYNAAASVVDGILAEVIQAVDETQARLDADAEARQALADGEVLSQEQRNDLMSAGERERVQAELDAQRGAALAMFAVQKAFAISSIAMDTAVAATKAIATIPPPGGEIAAGLLIAFGVAQGAIVAAQEPEFHDGGEVTAADRVSSLSSGLDASEVRAVLEVGEYVVDGATVAAMGGPRVLDAIKADPSHALAGLAAVSPVAGLSAASRTSPSRARPSSPPAASAADAARAMGVQVAGAGSSRERDVSVTTKIDGRTFDTVLAQGLQGQRLPRVRRELRRYSGTRVGLDI